LIILIHMSGSFYGVDSLVTDDHIMVFCYMIEDFIVAWVAMND